MRWSASTIFWIAVLATTSGCFPLQRRMAAQNVVTARQLSLRGADAVQRGDWKQAEALYASAVKACPVDERAQAGYARSLWHCEQQPKAVKHMEEAVRLSAGDPDLLVQLGNMYLEYKITDRALAQAEQAIRVQPQMAAAWALHGRALHEAGQLDEALGSYHRAIGFAAGDPEVQLAIAEIYRAQDRPQRALSTLAALSDRYNPEELPPRVVFLKGLALKRLGRYEDSAEQLAIAAQMAPPDAELLYELAEARLLAGDAGGARLALHQSLNLFPGHAPTQQLVVRLQHQQIAGGSDTSVPIVRY